MKRLNLLYTLLICALAANAQSPHATQLYGMTQYGGPDHFGSIFHFTPSTQTVTVDYNFQIKVKGIAPKCELVAPGNGKYYGTTTQGGANNAGVIFDWDSITGNYNELYDFDSTDGFEARGAMALYNGKLYGMTKTGGANNFGVIYEYAFATNTYTKKIDLDSINGKNPDGTLTPSGNIFYGFTHDGGLNNKGVLFEWNPTSNVYTNKYDFDSISGSNPVGKLTAYNGKFYAMTNKGGSNNLGVIYEWDFISNSYTKKFDFDSINGQYPLGYLSLYNNKFYGMTYEGGIYETSSPYDHFGVLFEWNPITNIFIKKKDMGDNAGGTHGSLSSLTLKGNVFWGVTSEGTGGGAIFSWNPVTNIFTDYFYNTLTPFSNTGHCEFWAFPPGLISYGALLLTGDKLLGTSSADGGNGAGCIFEYFPDSNHITRAVHMQATDGTNPRGSLSKVGNKLYGLSFMGGNNHCGNIFEWNLSTQQFTERFQFDGNNTGVQPFNNLTFLNNKFYGFNRYGRLKQGGVGSYFATRHYTDIFSWDPVTNNYQTLYSYDSIQTTLSLTSFTAFNNKLYATRYGGFLDTLTGVTHYGAVVQFDPATNNAVDKGFIVGGSFANYQDNESANSVTAYNGKLYGLTSSQGLINFKGTIYEWDTASQLAINKINFVDSIGSYPTGDLVLVDSVFYGLTTGNASGGQYAFGSLFKWNPVTNSIEKKWNIGGNGTPTYSGGKLYYFVGDLQTSVVEYDPVLDTAYYYNLPTFPGSQPIYSWFDFLCKENSYQKLLEVIPNQDPLLSNIPTTQTVCSNQINTATFTLSDADNDTMSFQISSSNTALISVTNISITNIDSVYTITYTGIANQTGTTTLSFIANDGYGDSVSFSFVVNVLASPNLNVTQNSTTLTAQQIGATYQWIDCNNNNTAISGATNQSYTATSNGNYAVVVTNTNGCSDTSTCISITTVGIDENDFQNSISISPNPVKDFLNIYITSNKNFKVEKLIIKNLIGETVYVDEKKYLQTNISKLATGIYTVELITDKGTWVSKFAKE